MLATQQFRRALFVGLVASAALAAELQTQSQTKIAVDYRSGMEFTGTERKSAKQCLGKNVNHCFVDHCGEDAVASACGEGDYNPGGDSDCCANPSNGHCNPGYTQAHLNQGLCKAGDGSENSMAYTTCCYDLKKLGMTEAQLEKKEGATLLADAHVLDLKCSESWCTLS